jgi:hypothetical protein
MDGRGDGWDSGSSEVLGVRSAITSLNVVAGIDVACCRLVGSLRRAGYRAGVPGVSDTPARFRGVELRLAGLGGELTRPRNRRRIGSRRRISSGAPSGRVRPPYRQLALLRRRKFGSWGGRSPVCLSNA